jgi:hypothetical protein
LLMGDLLQSQKVTPSSPHSIMRWLLESALQKVAHFGRFAIALLTESASYAARPRSN